MHESEHILSHLTDAEFVSTVESDCRSPLEQALHYRLTGALENEEVFDQYEALVTTAAEARDSLESMLREPDIDKKISERHREELQEILTALDRDL